ncbi:hypothetical protein [Streptosporangium sp. NPDC001681]|uniref:hypothetical protein n=1 Tax=Streptosporangium sp. NPDC001681 TaxID=3154395 RepID=UPI003321D924
MTTPVDPNQPDPRREPWKEPDPESPVPDPGETPNRPPPPVPEEPRVPPHPDTPVAPEVPQPDQAGDPDAPKGDETPESGGREREVPEPEERPPHPVPGATPAAYPGWEGASEAPGGPDHPGPTQPSRYEPPEPSAEPAAQPRPTEPAPGTPQPGYSGRHAYGEQPRYGEAQQAGQPYGGPGPQTPSAEGPYQPPQGAPGPYQPPPYPPPGMPAYPGAAPYPAYPGEGRRQSDGLGTAALVLGIVAIVSLVVCGLGVLVAIVGLIVGIVALVKKSAPGRAWVGIALSVLTLIIAAAFLSWLYSKIGDCANLPPELQQRCIEDRFGVRLQPTP